MPSEGLCAGCHSVGWGCEEGPHAWLCRNPRVNGVNERLGVTLPNPRAQSHHEASRLRGEVESLKAQAEGLRAGLRAREQEAERLQREIAALKAELAKYRGPVEEQGADRFALLDY